ncbi:MAG: hypothetical protein ABJE66_39475 [Deltaproteobacteria bacterium]
MRLVACMVAITSLGSSLAGAQPALSLSPPGATLPIAPRSTAPDIDSSTVTGQVLLGGVLGLGGLLAGGYLVFMACGTQNCSNEDGTVVPVIIGAYAGGSLGIATGAYLVGNNATAEGSFGAAFGGALLGGGAGFGAAAIVDKMFGHDHEDASELLETTAVLGGWIGGSLVGYYMTRHCKPSGLADVRPTLRADSHGMAFGIGASF